MHRVLLAVVLAVALPVLVRVATAGRLSAALRERRLANLRLGMTPTQTRTVSIIQAGVAATAGTVAGVVIFFVTGPALTQFSVQGAAGRLSRFARTPPTSSSSRFWCRLWLSPWRHCPVA